MTVPGNVAGSNGLGVADVPSLSKATAKAADDSGAGGSGSGSPELAIDVAHLTFAFPSHDPALVDLTLALPRGARCVLVGANGAGKSTLLQVLAGKRLTPSGARVNIRGRDVFRRASAGVTFLGTEWAMNPVVRGDIKVSEFLDSVGGYRHAERRNRLLDLLDVDLDWHMHAISDGERRRVQLVMGLMAPWDVLLLDEVTVDLDVLVRDELLAYLKEESESRSATVLYATHIFDGLEAFPTHLAHMRFGSFVAEPLHWQPPAPTAAGTLTLHAAALRWLKEDREHRRTLEAAGQKLRGARRDQKEPTDSETFFRKYDYSN